MQTLLKKIFGLKPVKFTGDEVFVITHKGERFRRRKINPRVGSSYEENMDDMVLSAINIGTLKALYETEALGDDVNEALHRLIDNGRIEWV